MFVDKPSGERARWRAYAATLGACAIFLGLAGLAVQIDTDRSVATAAQPEAHSGGVFRVFRLSARPDERVVPKVSAAHAPLPPQPVVISRAPEDGRTGAVEPAELPSPDTDEGTSTERWSPDRTDTFRTVCVRLCDGAFFPVSFATTRDRFKADAARCKAGCGSPARLFVGPPDGATDDLADVKGQPYAALPNAFRFQTIYDASCTCKGQPWEMAERERHKVLAEAAAVDALKPVAPDSLVANAPVAGPRLSNSLEITALHPAQPARPGSPGEPVRLSAGRAPTLVASGPVTAAVTAVEVGERKKVVPRKVARGAGKGMKPAKDTVGKFTNPFQIVFGPPLKPGKAATAKVADTSMQRPFKSKEYWRLSYWEVPN